METEFILFVKNQETARAFYEKVLNLKPSLDVPGMTEFTLAPNVKLGLMPGTGVIKIFGSKTPNITTANGVPCCELYLKYGNVREYFSHAVNAGGKIVSEIAPRDWGDEVAYVADPDGHIIAFAASIK